MSEQAKRTLYSIRKVGEQAPRILLLHNLSVAKNLKILAILCNSLGPFSIYCFPPYSKEAFRVKPWAVATSTSEIRSY